MRLALALALLSPLAGATTYVVDVANGPGTDFTQIATAIAAASPGDTLLVRSGQYQSFVLDKSPTIANLDQLGPGGTMLSANQGAVMIDDLETTSGVSVSSCTDVRFRRLAALAGMQCGASRVEIADSLVSGGTGSGTCSCCNYPSSPPPAGPGLVVLGGEVHLARTSVIGGHGAPLNCIDPGICDGDGGAGGPGLQLQSGARVVISGTSNHFVQGGAGGSSVCASGNQGPSGAALLAPAGCELRISGASLIGTVDNGGTLITPVPADPTLFALDAPQAGTLWTLRAQAPAGSTVDVVLGRRPTLAPTPPLDGEPMCPVHRLFHLGVVPENGTISLNFPVPPTWPQGFSVVFQSVVTLPDASVRFTNSVPAVMRSSTGP